MRLKKLTSIATFWIGCYTTNVIGLAIDPLQRDSKAWEPLTHAAEHNNETVYKSTSLLPLPLPSVNSPNNRAQLQSRNQIDRSPEWHTYKKKGHKHILELEHLKSKVEQNPVPSLADIAEDRAVLTKENFECNGWEVEAKHLKVPDTLDVALLTLLGMPTESYPGSRRIVQQEADRTLWEDPGEANLFYEGIYCPDIGGVIAERNYKTYEDDDGKEHTAPFYWADATFSAWFTECEEAGVSVDSLKWVIRKEIINEITLGLIGEMQDVVTPEARTVNGVKFQIYTLTPKDDDFLTLFASPNGNGVFYILRDHMRALKKSVKTIYVILNSEKEKATGNYIWSSPHMVLKF